MDFDMKVTAQASTWQNLFAKLLMSSEQSRDAGDSTSFLSCALFTAGESALIIESESQISSTHIEVSEGTDGISYEGTGTFMVPIKDVISYLSKMPASCDVDISFSDDEGKFYVRTEDGEEIEFSHPLVTIVDEDAAPRATVDFSDNSFIFSAPGSAVLEAYKSGSVMSSATDKDPLSGQDPLSGAVVNIYADGNFQVFSLAKSSAESWIDGGIESPPNSEEDRKRCLTEPSITSSRLALFSEADSVQVGIGANGRIHISDDISHMSVAPLNVGSRSDKMNIETILKVAAPVWENRVVQVKTSSKDFFAAMGRASITKATALQLSIGDTSIKAQSVVDGKKGDNSPFKQSIASSTQWIDDGEHWIEVTVSIDTVKKIASLVGKDSEMRFDVSCKPNGDPWAMVIREEDYDPENPHNFFLIPLQK